MLSMATPERRYIKTKFEGVFYRLSAKRDPRTGEADRIYCFSWQDAQGRNHWKTVGRHSEGHRPQTVRLARAEFLAGIAAGDSPHRADMTVGDAVEAYVMWAKAEAKQMDRIARQYELHLRPFLHALPIASVTPGMLSEIKYRLLTTRSMRNPARTLSPQSVKHLFAFVRASIYRAITTGQYKGANPLASKRGGPWQMPVVDNGNLRFFTPDEARRLLDELARRSKQIHDMALVALKTGLRATEIFRLRGQDVDSHANVLHVTSKGGKVISVPAPIEVIDLLASYNRRGAEPIFQARGTEGERIKETSDTFNRAVEALRLDTSDGDPRYAVTFHTLRHTFASWLAQSGKVTLLELQKLMRHKNIEMTQRYAHLIPGQERCKLDIIKEVLGKDH